MNRIFRQNKRLPVLALAFAGLQGTLFAANGAVAADTYIDSGNAATNFGSAPAVLVSPTATGLLQFDLSSVPALATIKRATLVLYVSKVSAGGSISVSPVIGPWSEGSAVYGAGGTPGIGAPTGAFTAGQQALFVSVDLTSQVQSWVTNPGSNFGIALTSSAASIAIDSKESTGTSHSAFLSIDVLTTGPAGPTGAIGPQGSPGQAGPLGIAGATGPRGPNGPTGPTGANGPTGPIGSAGPAGPVGPLGPVGPRGGNGPAGVAGSQGPTGPTGPTGFPGATGSPGPKGPTGPVGAFGPTGPVGIQGPDGPTGPNGPNAPYQNAFPANGSGAAPLTGNSIPVDTKEVIFVAATDPSTNGQSVTLPPAVTGKALWIIGNYTTSGNVFTLFTQGSDVIVPQIGGTVTSFQVGYAVHLLGASGKWYIVLGS